MLEPLYDSYAATITFAGATPRTVPLRPPDFATRPRTRCARRSPAAAAPGCCCSTRPTTRPAGCSTAMSSQLVAARAPSTTSCASRTRSTSTSCSTASTSAGDAAGNGGAHADRLERRQVVLVHRLEDRLGVGPPGARRRHAHGQAVPDLQPGARRSSTAPRPRSRCPATVLDGLAAICAQPRSAVRGPERGRLASDRAAGHLLRRTPTSAPTPPRSAATCLSARAWWPSPRRPSTTTRNSPRRSCASRSASDPR